MAAILQLRLGSQELLRLASSVSATEPGLVTGAQVAEFLRECLQNPTLQHLTLDGTDYNEILRVNAAKGASFSLQGGDATLSLMLENGTLYIGETAANSSNVYFDIPVCFQGGFDVSGGTPGQVLTKTKLNAVWADSPSSASSQSYYEMSTTPAMHVTRTTLPVGWYKVELLLLSYTPADCNAVFNPASITGEKVCNVMGTAYNALNNKTSPHITVDGLNWQNHTGESSSHTMATCLEMSFFYHHTGVSLMWPSESMADEGRGWATGSFRYTSIALPQTLNP